MIPNNKEENSLHETVELLQKQQDSFQSEITQLRAEVKQLKGRSKTSRFKIRRRVKSIKRKREVEKFIGESIISRIGIVITLIGVAIGAKLSIDNGLLSPSVKITGGYLLGFIFLALGFSLKRKYLNFSAILSSGAVAILYFISYASYSFYDIISLPIASTLMVLITSFGVWISLKFDKQVIAQLGLVGAYAIPFLPNNSTLVPETMLTYMVIINIGILIISLRKYWKPLYYLAFITTWAIMGMWSRMFGILSFETELIFGSIFFFIFYLVPIGYKLIRNEYFDPRITVLILTNSVIFYSLAYPAIDSQTDLIGEFTLANGLLHAVVYLYIRSRKLKDKKLQYLIAGLSTIFFTLAIPIKLEGDMITILWSMEAVVLFYIGRAKRVYIYELFSYPLMVLAFVKTGLYWIDYIEILKSGEIAVLKPFYNINFIVSTITTVSFAIIVALLGNKKYKSRVTTPSWLPKLFSIIAPIMLIAVVYFSSFLELKLYSRQLLIPAVNDFTWQISYSILFASILSLTSLIWIKSRKLTGGTLALNLVFLCLLLKLLIENSINSIVDLKYITLTLTAMMIFLSYLLVKKGNFGAGVRRTLDIAAHITSVVAISHEIIYWIKPSETMQLDQIGITTFWGFYSLCIITFGIWRKKKEVRILAIALFGCTLVKLLIYDTRNISAFAQFVIFITLGITLLVISFLYNKYKHIITGEDEDDENLQIE